MSRIEREYLWDSYLKKKDKLAVNINNLEDIKDAPFILTKDDMRNNYPNGLCFVGMDKIAQYHESFGTTGKPTANWLTMDDLNSYSEQILLSPVNINKGDLMLIRFPYALSTPAHIFHKAVQYAGGAVIPCSSRSKVSPYKRVLRLLDELKPTLIGCLPTEILELGSAAKYFGIDINKFALRAICTAGEVLTPSMKSIIEKQWGVPVYNFYGSTEAGNVAWSCSHGNLHLAEEHFEIEILGEDILNGEMILTTKSKEAFPLLKYKTEDFISINEEKCSCGHPHKTFIHYGRMINKFAFNSQVFSEWEIKELIFKMIDREGFEPFWSLDLSRSCLYIQGFNTKKYNVNDILIKNNLSFLNDIQPLDPERLNKRINDWELIETVGKPQYFVS